MRRIKHGWVFLGTTFLRRRSTMWRIIALGLVAVALLTVGTVVWVLPRHGDSNGPVVGLITFPGDGRAIALRATVVAQVDRRIL